MEKVTVIIPTFNEESNIEAALQSVEWADEIMVVDSFSTDRTLEIARKYTDRVLVHAYENSAAQKNWAIPQASHSWVFILDADEIVSPDLAAEIKQILREGTQASAFMIYRLNYFMGKLIRYSGWQGDKVIRLFKRDECRYEEKQVHAGVLTEGKVKYLKNKLRHYTYKDLAWYLHKTDRYATWGAKDRMEKVKRVTFYHLLLKPIFRFIQYYFFRGGILDGKHGLVISILSAWAVFLRYLKLWRLKSGEEIE